MAGLAEGAAIAGLIKIVVDEVRRYRGTQKTLKDSQQYVQKLYLFTKHLDMWKRVHEAFYELDYNNFRVLKDLMDSGDYKFVPSLAKKCNSQLNVFRIGVLPLFDLSDPYSKRVFAQHSASEVNIDDYMGSIANNMIIVSSNILYGRKLVLDFNTIVSGFSFDNLVSSRVSGILIPNEAEYIEFTRAQQAAAIIIGASDTVMRESIPILNFLIGQLVTGKSST